MADHYSTVTQSRLKELYEYNPESGLLISKLFNKPVGSLQRGYLVVELWDNGKPKTFRVHRLIWLYVYGQWPSIVDHINGIKTDNRLNNLRQVTAKQNAENRIFGYSKLDIPKSGYKGVHWYKPLQKWKAAIGHKGKVIYLGMFDDPKEAFSAYKAAAEKLHTHNEQIKPFVF